MKEMLEDASTSTEAAAGFFDVLGDDAPLYLDAMGELLGVGGALTESFATGGVEALESLLAEMAAGSDLTGDFLERASDVGAFGGFGSSFIEMPGSDVGDIFGYGQWDGPNHNDFDPNGKNAGLMQDNSAREAAADLFWGAMTVTAGGVAVAALAPSGHIKAGGALVAIGGGIVSVGAGIRWVQEAASDAASKKADDAGSEVTFIPADPNAEYEGLVDFTPHWVEGQVTNAPTYGQVMTDPESEDLSGIGEKAPEDELAREIITDPDLVQTVLDAAKVAEAASANVDHKIIPITPEVDTGELPFEFKFGPKGPEGTGGETSATATEYIVKVFGGETEELSLQDTMIFAANPQTGEVVTEGTSGAMLEGQMNEAEAGVYVPETIF